MGSFLEDLDGHEGYGARRLPDGTLTATWSAATARFDAYVAACSCGWQGGDHPPSEQGYEAALDQWDAGHARPLLALMVPADVADAVAAAKDALAQLAGGERPAAARRALDDLARWADGRLEAIDAPSAVSARHHPPIEQSAGGACSVGRRRHAAIAWRHVLEGWHGATALLPPGARRAHRPESTDMAHIEKRGPGRWRARYRDPDGRELSRTFARRTDAERFLALTEADKAHGAWIDPAAGRTPFGAYARAWQQAQVHRGTTADQVASNLRNHILPAFEHRPLGAVRPSEVQAWVRSRAEELAPSSVEVVYRYLAAIFGAAVRDRMIARSPCVGIRLPRVVTAEVRPATTDDVLAIADAVPPRYRALVLFTAGTGLRQGEAFGVVLPNLDLDAGEVRVDRQVVLRAGHPPVVAPPKTDASFRTIPLPAGVVAVVRAHLAAFPATTRPEHGALVFTTPAGEPLRRNRFGDLWRAAVRRSGARPDLTFHDLRHYYASLLIRHGESVKVVQRRLGHKTAKETLDTYGHLWPDSDDRTRDAVDAELFRAGARCVTAGDRKEPDERAGDHGFLEIPRPGRGLGGSADGKPAGQRLC